MEKVKKGRLSKGRLSGKNWEKKIVRQAKETKRLSPELTVL